jgi:predicted MFS family arabinose efflux permease
MKSWNRNFRLLATAVFCVGAFFGIQFSLFNNFIVERLGIEAHELGYMEALREVPGFLNALFIALMIRFAPPLVAGFSLIVMGLGLAAYAEVNTFQGVLICSFVWSIGFHAWIPLRGAMALGYSEGDEKGKPLGQLRSVESLAMLATIGLCMFAVNLLEFEGLFVVGGCVAALGGVAIMFASSQLQAGREERLVFRKRYWLYYLLSFLGGCRRQIFITFAIFALVKVYSTDRNVIIKLALINQVVVFVFAPLMGRFVDKLGERITLSASYFGLVFVFIGYAVLKDANHLYALYCVDNFLYIGGIALTTYLNKLAPPHDLKPTLAMGVTMNHVAAVTAPLIGGLAWMKFGYHVIFLSGAVVAVASLLAVQWIKTQPAVLKSEAEVAAD